MLTVSRPEPPHEQSIPGGVVDPGENPAQAAVRELREECAVDPRDPVHATVVRSPTDGRRVHVFVANGCRGTARAAEPDTRVAWLLPEQLLAQARLYRSTVHELMAAGLLGEDTDRTSSLNEAPAKRSGRRPPPTGMFIEHRSGYRPTSPETVLDDLHDVMRRGGYIANIWQDGHHVGVSHKSRDGKISVRWVAQETTLRETTAPLEEVGTWYHGSPQRFEQFQSRVGRTFGSGASEVPLFLTRDPKFAALYAGANGFIYTVRPHVERTFDAREFVLNEEYWPPPRDALTPEGQELFDDLVDNRIFPEMIRYGTKHEDEDEWQSMHDTRGTYAAIFARNYDVLETTEMKRWLRAHGYDSFLVSGDGPEDNLAVFDPEQIEILSVQPV